MSIRGSLLSVHNWWKGYLSISMGTNPVTGLCIGHSSTSFIITQILDEMLDDCNRLATFPLVSAMSNTGVTEIFRCNLIGVTVTLLCNLIM